MHLRVENIESFVKCHRAIGDIAQKNSVDFLVNCGDMFDKRGVIKTILLKVLYEERSRWCDDGLVNIDIVGNHDQADRDGEIHPLKVYERFRGWKVFDKPCLEDYHEMLFLPYVRDTEGVLKSFKKHDQMDCVGHCGVSGATSNGTEGGLPIKDIEGVHPKFFRRFKNVFLGHYHAHQKIKNIIYIGSPMQHSFGEVGQTKGVLFYDQATGKKRFIEIGGLPRFHDVEVTFKKGKPVYDLPEVSPFDKVRAIVRGSSKEVSKITKSTLGLPCFTKIENKTQSEMVSRLKVDDIGNEIELIEKYVDFVEHPFKRKELMEVYKEIANV